MGEFLLSILGFNDAREIIYTRMTRNARYKLHERVGIYYPHGKHNKPYLRIYGKAYDHETITLLLESQDPNVIDRDSFSRYQKERRDEHIYNQLASGREAKHVAYEMGWVAAAVLEAAQRHMARIEAERKPKMKSLLDEYESLDYDELEQRAINTTRASEHAYDYVTPED